MDGIKKFLVHILTGLDNNTFDVARVLWVVSCLVFLVLAIVHVVVNKQPFDAQNFGLGAGGVLLGGGAGVGLKGNTEPSN